jgi:ubiquinol-cytochrome c reductase cytochrome b subunit
MALKWRGAVLDWLDARTGYRAGLGHLLDEPLPHGVGWWFVTGSILLFLVGVQLLTGVVLAMYYVPSPDHAYESVRFIMDRLPLGGIVRGLHVFGASFIIVAAGVHILRVVLFGSYKKPREATWMTGVVLLLILLGFALSGYLLPWDQKAYWATTVTINIARSAPVGGEFMASLMRGGADLGALTLGRWYAAHVFLLPAALVGFVLAHIYLMRRHGISGPITPTPGEPAAFYPYQALRDSLAMAAVFSALLAMAIAVPAPLEPIADPTDASYIPRPEWYFLSLFQLLKYFPGPLEPVATIVIPGLVVTGLLLLPFLDRGVARRPLERVRVLAPFATVVVAILSLTALGLRDMPGPEDPARWGLMPLGGRQLAQKEQCLSCHREDGAGSPFERQRLRRGSEWAVLHASDPEVIAPGGRRPPPGSMNRSSAAAVLAYVRKMRAGAPEPLMTREVEVASLVYARHCGNCHVIDGDGFEDGPELTHVGAKRDAKWLRAWIIDPAEIDPDAEMQAFGDRLSEEELTAIVTYLARRN